MNIWKAGTFPEEDIVLEICWNGDPGDIQAIYREFLPEPCCECCMNYNGDVCTKNWNNMDESYYNPNTDDVFPEDVCDDWQWNEELETLRERPMNPKRCEYKTEKAYQQAVAAVHWWRMKHPESE